MTRTSLMLLTSAAAATTLAGCGRGWHHHNHDADLGPMRTVSELQCPDHEGSLTRVSVATDGLSCTYAGPRGAEVELKLVKPANGSSAALDELDGQMNALMPEVEAKVAEAPAKTEDAATDSSSSPENARDRADINIFGLHIKTRGQHAEIRGPGISIDADDDKGHNGSGGNGNAHVTIGGGLVDVRAHNDAAIVRVRGRGPAVRAEYRLADETASPAGWKLVGYAAHGPENGPLVVAVVRSKDKEQDPLFRDAQRLVKQNTGS